MKFNTIFKQAISIYITLFSSLCLNAQTYLEIPTKGTGVKITGLANEIELIGHDKENLMIFEKNETEIHANYKNEKEGLSINLEEAVAAYQIYITFGYNVNLSPDAIFYENNSIDSLDQFKEIQISNLDGNLDLTADAFHVNVMNHQGNASIVTYGNITAYCPDYLYEQRIILDTYLGSVDVSLAEEGTYNLKAEANNGKIDIDNAIKTDSNSKNFFKIYSEKGIKVHVGVLENFKPGFKPSPIKYILDPSKTDHVKGTGELHAHTRMISNNYGSVTVENGIHLFIIPSTIDEIKVIAEKNIIPLVETKISDNNLMVHFSEAAETYKGVKVELYTSNNEQLNITGKSGSFTYFNPINFTNLKMTVMAGSEAELAGAIRNADIFVKGGSLLKAKDCSINNLTITAKGASEAKVNVINAFTASVENWSKIMYKGNPKAKSLTTDDKKSKIIRLK